MNKHPLQSKEWGEFRESTRIKVVRQGDIQVTIHHIPYTPWNIGYCPKGPLPDEKQVATLTKIARENNCIAIKCEPLVEVSEILNTKSKTILKKYFKKGRPLFTKYNFVLDVSQSEEELLKNMKQKTRYNIRVAEKRGVTVEIDNSPTAFEKYLELTRETTKRQGFYAHSEEYQRKMWETLRDINQSSINNHQTNSNSKTSNKLTANLLVAKYGPPSHKASDGRGGEIITTWVLFRYGETLYYPYGASSREHREVMANNLVMWAAIKLAKKWGLKNLDMWGALGPEADPKDPWYGFHKFKEGYGGRLVEYIGTFDYVAKPLLYYPYRLAEWARWRILKLLK